MRRTRAMVLCCVGLPLFIMPGENAVTANEEGAQHHADRIVEIRSYNLKPGTRERFHRLFVEEALPLLQQWQIEVIAYGPSTHDADSYFLMRAYADNDERRTSEDAFYGSDEWREGPREAILDCIESYTTVVVPLDAATIEGLRKLSSLNEQG
ncbi:MAG: NIPSNAP family protein [Gammaproteobacteria bacterium]